MVEMNAPLAWFEDIILVVVEFVVVVVVVVIGFVVSFVHFSLLRRKKTYAIARFYVLSRSQLFFR